MLDLENDMATVFYGADFTATFNQLVQLYDRGLAEGDVIYRLENIDVGGGLVLGLFTVDYRDPG